MGGLSAAVAGGPTGSCGEDATRCCTAGVPSISTYGWKKYCIIQGGAGLLPFLHISTSNYFKMKWINVLPAHLAKLEVDILGLYNTPTVKPLWISIVCHHFPYDTGHFGGISGFLDTSKSCIVACSIHDYTFISIYLYTVIYIYINIYTYIIYIEGAWTTKKYIAKNKNRNANLISHPLYMKHLPFLAPWPWRLEAMRLRGLVLLAVRMPNFGPTGERFIPSCPSWTFWNSLLYPWWTSK